MKKSTNILIIFSSISIIIGIIIVIVALLLGAKFDNFKTYNFNKSYNENINKINIKIDAAELIIKKGDQFKIDANDVIKDQLVSKINGDTWEIKHSYFKNAFYNFINNKFSYNTEITIYIPDEKILDEFSIDLGAGKGDIKKLNTKNITVDVGAGELVIDDLYSEKSNIDCGVGSVNITGIMIGNNKINNGVGNIELNLKGNEKNYNYRYDIGIGEVKINDISYSKGTGNNYINNNAANDFNIDCGVGNIKIDIKE